MSEDSHVPTAPSTQLVPIGTGDYPVLARDLHQALGVKRRFNDWWSDFVNGPTPRFALKFDFAEVLLRTEQNPRGGRPRKDFSLRLDVAKKIAMMAKTSKGDEVRDYFLECERRAIAAPPEDDDALILRAVGVLQVRVQVAEQRALLAEAGRELAEHVAEDRRSAQEWADDVIAGESLVDTKTALKLAAVPGCARLTRALWEDLDRVFFGPWKPRAWRRDFVAQGLGSDVPTTVGKGKGRKLVSVPKWTPKGAQHLREWLLERRRQAVLAAR